MATANVETHPNAITNQGAAPGRAELLARRIEEGANLLAAFAIGISDEEWNTPISESDRRTVGVVVHHVASVYQVEVQLAQAIAHGNSVAEVTWEVVNRMNGEHASAQASVTKDDALALLRKNSQEAADAVRAFTDTELDTAGSFGLSYGAPVTAQFAIEDHALRHSWHHLARIRKAINR